MLWVWVRGRGVRCRLGVLRGPGSPHCPPCVCRGGISSYLGTPKQWFPGKGRGSWHPPTCDPGGGRGQEARGVPELGGGADPRMPGTSPEQAAASPAGTGRLKQGLCVRHTAAACLQRW